MNLLVLPDHTQEDQAIWREALRRGWKTLRFKPTDNPDLLDGYDRVRYYGNVLHYKRIKGMLPCIAPSISPTLLKDLDISWTGREVDMIEFGDLAWPLKEDKFIKCVDVKWLEARVYKAGERPTSQWQGMLDTDKIYVQTPVKFINEIRCFVHDKNRMDEIVTASYYIKGEKFYPENIPYKDIPVQIKAMAWTLMEEHMREINKFPSGVVLDFGQDDYGHWSLIEANEAWASGLYDCDPTKVFDVIVASQSDK